VEKISAIMEVSAKRNTPTGRRSITVIATKHPHPDILPADSASTKQLSIVPVIPDLMDTCSASIKALAGRIPTKAVTVQLDM
jgi:hypothetical protein